MVQLQTTLQQQQSAAALQPPHWSWAGQGVLSIFEELDTSTVTPRREQPPPSASPRPPQPARSSVQRAIELRAPSPFQGPRWLLFALALLLWLSGSLAHWLSGSLALALLLLARWLSASLALCLIVSLARWLSCSC